MDIDLTTLLLSIIPPSAIVGAVITYILENRRQNKERGYTTYLQSALEYIKIEKLMLQDDDLKDAYSYFEFYRNIDPKKKKIYHLYAMMIMLFELVYHAHNRKWTPQDEWEGWDTWMSEMMGVEFFRQVWDDTKSHYQGEFGRYMDNLGK